MDDVAVDAVGYGRADGAAGLVGGTEHEVVDQQLRAPVEELCKRLGPCIGLEAVLLVDRHPGELPSLSREFVVAAGELPLPLQQLRAGGPPPPSGAHPSVV